MYPNHQRVSVQPIGYFVYDDNDDYSYFVLLLLTVMINI